MNESQAVTYKTLIKDASYGEAGPDERAIAAYLDLFNRLKLTEDLCGVLAWLCDQVVEVALAVHGEIVHTDSFHRCWQGHRASWPVGVGIVEPTLYPDSG